MTVKDLKFIWLHALSDRIGRYVRACEWCFFFKIQFWYFYDFDCMQLMLKWRSTKWKWNKFYSILLIASRLEDKAKMQSKRRDHITDKTRAHTTRENRWTRARAQSNATTSAHETRAHTHFSYNFIFIAFYATLLDFVHVQNKRKCARKKKTQKNWKE